MVGVEGAADDDGLNDDDEVGLGDESVAGVLGVSFVLRLERDVELRIDGVSKDSRAFGSCSCTGRPIEGLCTTYCGT